MIVTINYKIIEEFLLVTDKLLGSTCPINGGFNTEQLDEVMRTYSPDLYKWYADE